MKVIVFNILAFLCFTFYANGQEANKVRNVHLQVGTANGGMYISPGYEKLFGRDHTNSFFISANFQSLSRSDEVVQLVLPEKDIFLSTGYRKYFPVSYRVFPYAGLNVLAGYQYIGNAQNGMYEHRATHDFLYGVGAHTGVELRLNPISFYLEGGYMFEFDHTWLLGAGIKYYF